MRYYSITKLKPDAYIVGEDRITVFLDGIDTYKIIGNDDQFNNSLGDDGLYWLSGGGSFILNNEYLLIVRRPLDSRVHPGLFSVFNGRSGGLQEWLNPELIVRELFEELILIDDGILLYPKNKRFQLVIDKTYDTLKKNGIISKNKVKDIDLSLNCTGLKKIILHSNNNISSLDAMYTLGNKNDLNILFLFNIDGIDIGRLKAVDGECSFENDKLVRQMREIPALNLWNGKMFSINTKESIEYCDEQFSPNLKHIIDTIKK